MRCKNVAAHNFFAFVIPSSAPSGHLPPGEGIRSINWDLFYEKGGCRGTASGELVFLKCVAQCAKSTQSCKQIQHSQVSVVGSGFAGFFDPTGELSEEFAEIL